MNGRSGCWVAAAAMLLALPAWASRIVTDELGRKVTVPDQPRRVVCLAPSVTDTVYAIGAGDLVVAISDYTKYPSEALQKPSVGEMLNPSVETILAMHPDLVLGVSTLGPSESVKTLERLGVPVFLVSPHGIDGILRATRSTGVALHREAAADALAARLEARIAAVQARVAGLPRPAVLMALWYDPVITIGRQAFITEIITAAGGRSVTDDLTEEWPQVSLEALMARKPEALVLMRGGRMTLAMLKDRAGWSGLPAIRDGRVYSVDERIELPSPVAIDALEALAKEFHP